MLTAEDAELFRAQMLTEMARMSLEDGLVMQIHPGSLRNHNPMRSSRRSAATWAPTSRRRTDYVRALKPLLDRFGNERELTLILFTLDETAYFARARAARRAIIRSCGSGRPGGSTIRPRACGASAS